ncbi:zf-HC2 domain-containing protein [Streptomyces sp. ACA25]|uniref:anti-sigma factor family protein n=1 Tax=Streptomyces sp. ACA25 TaxID=3022596 RepID=UPI002307099A|nr:zf-HC2 domain-containing protein [Streptomyces sp. ACA25]MDB1086778.1 zf-HC2 domain-containing protein [Streptomyces sp. ACA25]
MTWPWRRRAAEERRIHCLRVHVLLQRYLDGELDDPRTVRRIAVHLEECHKCGLEAAAYRQVKDALNRRAAPSADALDRLRAFGESLARGEEPPRPGGDTRAG